ncbi:IS5 family transposase [Micromonospora globbae]|uniref:IS5 family transposase n=1 Tax=Micromonospora globbae TaxID=1894969 RepID=A0A420EQJ4_9ACTN|nr:IS5 family transposase [Micromonospora globbae]RKF22947.1 IS5 family transposase [Micromonospora globbae]
MIRTWAPDDLWEIAAPLIPPAPVRRQGGGRRRVDDRAVLAAIVYVTQAGCSWWKLPEASFGVTRATAHRRFSQWTAAGFWLRLHEATLDRLGSDRRIDWSRAVVDSISVRAGKGGDLTGPNPVDRGKPGSKIHVICDRAGLPLAVMVTAANVHDSQLLLPMLDSVPAIRTPGGRRRWRPDKLHADKAYDNRALRAEVGRRGIGVRIARKGIESSTRLGRHRWIVESCLSWLMRHRRLVRRYDRKGDHFEAFATIASTLICYRRLTK